MVRWEPDSRGRLVQAALALYADRGYERTTVAQIAERAGLTERTFFRQFADKREVLFAGGSELQEALAAAVAEAPASATPIEAALAGLEAVAARLDERRDFARQRKEIIDATPELQERELIKLAAWASALAAALQARGDEDAGLTAELAIAAFRVAFARWTQGDARSLGAVVGETLGRMRTLA